MNLYKVSIEKILGRPPQLGDGKTFIENKFVVANSFREVCEAYPKAKKINTIEEGLDIIEFPT